MESSVPPCLRLYLDAEGRKAYTEEIVRRVKEWEKTGKGPEVVFYVTDAQKKGPIALSSQDGRQSTLLLFTTPWAALDYAEFTKIRGGVVEFKVEGVRLLGEQMLRQGSKGFMFNFCPRCRLANMFPPNVLLSEEEFARAWALETIQKRLLSQTFVGRYQALVGTDSKQAKAILEHIRDHVDSGNPYVHWLIAILAGMEGDEAAKAAAIARLHRFGPPFSEKLNQAASVDGDPDPLLRGMAEASVGLLVSNDMLKSAPQAPPHQPGRPS